MPVFALRLPASQVSVTVIYDRLPPHQSLDRLASAGVTTGSTCANRSHASEPFVDRAGLDDARRQIVFDPQTSSGLLLAVAADAAPALQEAPLASGHRAVDLGELIAGSPRCELR
jgi:selenide,water dikinase